jgi:hypothetical protein
LLADILFAFGATGCSFNINFDLVDPVACIRAAQTQAQDIAARNLAGNFLGTGARDEQIWETRLWEFAVAHTWARGSDEDVEDGLQQIIATTGAIITEVHDPLRDEFQDHLELLAPRGPRLDIPTYLFFRSAMEWHNRMQQHGEFNISNVLDQFICQHLAPRRQERRQERRVGPLYIDCISSCLAWCIDMLVAPQTIPPETPRLPHSIRAAETYLVLCTLWSLWISQPPGAAPEPLLWADGSEPQLGIRPTELLSTVVCMIMAAVPGGPGHPNMPVLAKALAGANALKELNPDKLLRCFLGQVWATNARLLAQPGEGRRFHLWRDAVDAGAFWPYVVFAASVLGIPWQTAAQAAGWGDGSVVYPIVLAEVE